MKPSLAIPLLTFILGAALAWGVQLYLNPPSEKKALQEQTIQLTQSVSALKQDLAQTGDRLASALQTKNSLQAELAREKQKAVSPPPSPSSETPKKSPWADVMREAMANQAMSRIDSLAMILRLTPEQVAQLKQSVQNAQNNAPSGNEPMAKYTSAISTLDKELNALLSPEQKKQYEDFKVREKNSQVEMMANAESSQLQSMLNLSPEQTDQVFTKLAEVAQKQFEPIPGSTNPAQILEIMTKRKKEALQGILTEDQLKLYEHHLAQQNEMAAKMMQNMK